MIARATTPIAFLCCLLIASTHAACREKSSGWIALDEYTLVAAADSPAAAPARNPDGSVNALVEIPAGTNAKWEIRERDGALAWEFENGEPRVVRYLAYPANYGMIPGTLLAAEAGGDGDPLDVIVLGPALERGALVRVRIVGALRLTDSGEQDDKLLAVSDSGPFAEVRDLSDLEAGFPGVKRIIETWFTSYKGPGVLESGGFVSAAEAMAILERAEGGYTAHLGPGA